MMLLLLSLSEYKERIISGIAWTIIADRKVSRVYSRLKTAQVMAAPLGFQRFSSSTMPVRMVSMRVGKRSSASVMLKNAESAEMTATGTSP